MNTVVGRCYNYIVALARRRGVVVIVSAFETNILGSRPRQRARS
jgi:hypothetical protein